MTPFPGLPVTVRSSHVDMFGHVSHMAYLEFMEWARFAWAEHMGTPIPRLMAEERMGPALLRVEVRYKQECRLGDDLLITVEPEFARRQLGRLSQRVLRGPDQEEVCRATMTFAMIDLDTRKVRELPPGFRGEYTRG